MDFSEKLDRRMLRSHAKANEVGLTVRDYLAENFHRFDAAGWARAIADGMVELNGIRADGPEQLKEHDCVAFYPGDLPEPEADLTFQSVYEDGEIIVFDKPGNLCVHPTGAFFRHTLWHLAGEKYGELRFVNRLDRETSGLVIAARNASVAAHLSTRPEALAKEYLAIVCGKFPDKLRAQGWLITDKQSAIPTKRCFVGELLPDAENAESADTEFALAGGFGAYSLVRAKLHTGRKHQIRATLFSLGYPLLGDKLYGVDESIFAKIRTRSITPEDYAKLGMVRQALHAAKLSVRHPKTGEMLTWTAPLPADMLAALNALQTPILHTARLVIAPMSDAEIQALIFHAPAPELKLAFQEMLTGCQTHPATRIWYAPWKIALRDAPETVIGELGFQGAPEAGGVEIGYGIEPEFEGQGYMTEAAGSAVHWALSQHGVTTVYAEAEAGNLPSRRVLEKLGFTPCGTGQEGIRFVRSRG